MQGTKEKLHLKVINVAEERGSDRFSYSAHNEEIARARSSCVCILLGLSDMALE
jgi:hypothetical protein